MAGDTTKLYLMLVSNNETMVSCIERYALLLMAQSIGDIRQMGICLNPDEDYTAIMLNGMNTDVYNAIPKAQTFADTCFRDSRPLHIFLEGRNYGGTAAAVQDLRKIPNVQAGNVSVVALQDYDYAHAVGGAATQYADVGLVLGITAKAQVNQNIAEVASFNIADYGRERYKTCGLSSHHTIREKEKELAVLDSKGWIIGITYADFNGVYLNDDHSCCEEILDKEGNLNESSIWKSRTLAKAVRLLRKALLHELKKRYPTHPLTGHLTADAIVLLKDIAEQALLPMLTQQEITQVAITIRPESNLFVGERALEIQEIRIVGIGNIGLIKSNIHLSNRI